VRFSAFEAGGGGYFLDISDEVLEATVGTLKVDASFTLGSCTGLSECPG